jgi:hypothetical protein
MGKRPIRFILENTKTGEAFTYASAAQCRRAARILGWADYTIEKDE